MTEHPCLDLCLETPMCRGASFNSSFCTIYDCTDMADGNDTVFYQRLCDIDCERNVTQTCLNCGASIDCPTYFTQTTDVGISSDCMTECNSSIDCSVVRFFGMSFSCYSYNCTRLRLNWRNIAYRKTCNEG
ncbi:hypothetical protein MAR_033064 [Mya arenaria]|uniref:Apple domain-containing protein n=1 Tax=Mya arenaria TaxID=6604 RepID=A0ABY7GB08_MYAAR|nr:hypothetical protein MAR_033064 [Mya arenaria]